MVKVARKRVNTVQHVTRLVFDYAIKDADRDAQWSAFLNEVWQPEAHGLIFRCLRASVIWKHTARLWMRADGRLVIETSLMARHLSLGWC